MGGAGRFFLQTTDAPLWKARVCLTSFHSFHVSSCSFLTSTWRFVPVETMETNVNTKLIGSDVTACARTIMDSPNQRMLWGNKNISLLHFWPSASARQPSYNGPWAIPVVKALPFRNCTSKSSSESLLIDNILLRMDRGTTAEPYHRFFLSFRFSSRLAVNFTRPPVLIPNQPQLSSRTFNVCSKTVHTI